MSFEQLKSMVGKGKHKLSFSNIAHAAQQAVHGTAVVVRKGRPPLSLTKVVKFEFDEKYVQLHLEAMYVWPCDRFQWTFAHYMWLVASPCLEWISLVLQGQSICPWSDGLQRCLASLQEDFVGVDDDEQDVHSLA